MTRLIQELEADGGVLAAWDVDPLQAAEAAVAPEALAEDCPELPADLPRIGDIPTDAPPVQFALAYVRAGVEIMPRYGWGKLVDALTGSPRTGFLREDEIGEHWDRNPRHQVAAVLGPDTGAFVVDVDQHGQEDGLASLRGLEAEHGRLPSTPFVLSPIGAGRHLYFAWPDRPIRTCQIAPGVEVLADRAAANLPPSRKAAGAYRWSLSRHPDWLPRAQAPAWLLELAAPPPPPKPKSRPAPTGERARYVEAAIAGELAETLVEAAIAAGHHQRDARQTVAGAIRRGAAR